MELGKATAIFRNIYNSEESAVEKILAIRTVCEMETHNGITKQEFLNALNWLVEKITFYDAEKVLEKLKRRIVFLVNYKELLHKNGDVKNIDKITDCIKEVKSLIKVIQAEVLR